MEGNTVVRTDGMSKENDSEDETDQFLDHFLDMSTLQIRGRPDGWSDNGNADEGNEHRVGRRRSDGDLYVAPSKSYFDHEGIKDKSLSTLQIRGTPDGRSDNGHADEGNEHRVGRRMSDGDLYVAPSKSYFDHEGIKDKSLYDEKIDWRQGTPGVPAKEKPFMYLMTQEDKDTRLIKPSGCKYPFIKPQPCPYGTEHECNVFRQIHKSKKTGYKDVVGDFCPYHDIRTVDAVLMDVRYKGHLNKTGSRSSRDVANKNVHVDMEEKETAAQAFKEAAELSSKMM